MGMSEANNIDLEKYVKKVKADIDEEDKSDEGNHSICYNIPKDLRTAITFVFKHSCKGITPSNIKCMLSC